MARYINARMAIGLTTAQRSLLDSGTLWKLRCWEWLAVYTSTRLGESCNLAAITSVTQDLGGVVRV
jgi:hypothetical protein